jgi:hypothetical protein
VDTQASGPLCGRRRASGLIRRWLVRTFIACACAVLAAPVHAQALAGAAHDADLAVVREILMAPEADIDLARAKLTIDRLIDPSVDVTATLSALDAMAAGLKAMLPAGASRRLRLETLRRHIYSPTAWNDKRPYPAAGPGSHARHRAEPCVRQVPRRRRCVVEP